MKPAAWRHREGLTQEQLAERFDCSRKAISAVECGRVPCARLQRQYFLASRGDVTPSDFYPLATWQAALPSQPSNLAVPA